MSLTKARPLRTLTRARISPRTPLTHFRRRYAAEDSNIGGASPGPNESPPKKPSPLLPITLAVTIPALAWFFWGTSRTTPTPPKKAATGEKSSAPANRPLGGTYNEEPSRSVPLEQPAVKEEKPASTKAVAPDEVRLESEKKEKENTLTGTKTSASGIEDGI